LVGRRRDPHIVHSRYREGLKNGDFRSALKEAVTLTKLCPKSSQAFAWAAASCLHLQMWRDAKNYATIALRLNPNELLALDVISHAATYLGQAETVRRYGSRALDIRAASVGDRPLFRPETPPPPPPSAETKRLNVISFSLYGANPKYCEVAVLNAHLQSEIYPYWTCRFYVDKSVPESVIVRLQDSGSEVIFVDGHEMSRWPGPMWRFSAHDDGLHRVIFRDADSMISQREAIAVNEWVDSGSLFHHIRDFGSHTELMLAGLWGCVAGALPSMEMAISRFLLGYTNSAHFADQYFLRSEVWPYVQGNLMSHDSVFGWRESKPLPDYFPYKGFHLGCVDGRKVSIDCALPEGINATWSIFDLVEGTERLIARYCGVVANGKVDAVLPRVYWEALVEGKMIVRVVQAE
jgi:hypothetical protein